MGNHPGATRNELRPPMGTSLGTGSSALRMLKSNKTESMLNKHLALLDGVAAANGSQRLVFISLLGLFDTWQNVPTVALFTSMFVLPLKRDWIYNPTQHKREIASSLLGKFSGFHGDSTRLRRFFELLRWKDSRGLVLFVLDHEHSDTVDSRSGIAIHAWWHAFNDKLGNMSDPVSKTTYTKIRFAMYKDSDRELRELASTALRYKAVMRIIGASNPGRLIPIKSYSALTIELNVAQSITPEAQIADTWICEDYV